MVEFALIAPLVIFLILGAVEIGLLFRDSLTLNNAARSGVRVLSQAKTSTAADQTAAEAIATAASRLGKNRVKQVVFFKPTDKGTMGAACKTQLALAESLSTPGVWPPVSANQPIGIYRAYSSSATSSFVTDPPCNIYPGEMITEIQENQTSASGYWSAMATCWSSSTRDVRVAKHDKVGVSLVVQRPWLTNLLSGVTGGNTFRLQESVVLNLEPTFYNAPDPKGTTAPALTYKCS